MIDGYRGLGDVYGGGGGGLNVCSVCVGWGGRWERRRDVCEDQSGREGRGVMLMLPVVWRADLR